MSSPAQKIIKFYLSASLESKPLMRERRRELEAMGHIVTSRWLDETGPSGTVAGFTSGMALYKSSSDLQDVDASQAVLVFTDPPSTTGGLHVEMGYALAKRKVVLVIGPLTNIFQRQAYNHFQDWNSFRIVLGTTFVISNYIMGIGESPG